MTNISAKPIINEISVSSVSLAQLSEHISDLEAKALWNDAEILLRSAIAAYPEEYLLVSELMFVNFQLIRRSPAETYRADEMIEIGERILGIISDIEIKNAVNRNLCFIYSVTGRRDMAEKHYAMLPSFDSCRELYAAYVMEGDELKAGLQHNIENYITCAATAARQLGYRESGERECALLSKSVELYELLYEDGDYGIYSCDMAMICLDIAQLKITASDNVSALDYIERALRYSDKYINTPDARHTSVLADRIEYISPASNGERLHEIVMDSLKNSGAYAPLRKDERFMALLKRK